MLEFSLHARSRGTSQPIRPHVTCFLFAIAACAVFLIGGCPGNEAGNSGNGPATGDWLETEYPITGDAVLDEALAEVASDNALMNEVVTSVEAQLEAGADLAQVRESAVAEFLADERVAGATVDDLSGFVWVEYASGTVSSLQLFDEGESGTAKDEAPQAASLKARTAPAPVDKSGLRAQADSSFYPRMPGNNKAYLGNAIAKLHQGDKDWDGSDATANNVELMLDERGYIVTRGDVTLQELAKITDYGVVLIDTHGGWHKSSRLSPFSGLLATEPGDADLVACNALGEGFIFVTSTPWSRAELEKFWGAGAAGLRSFARDLLCQRIGLHVIATRTRSGSRTTTKRLAVFKVSANFFRRHAKANFPDNTLFWLNGCSAVARNGASTMRDVLFEKCGQGAFFMSWQGNVQNDYAIRAPLNLFQLMTASNYSVTVAGFHALDSASPPRGGATSIYAAYGALAKKGYHFERRHPQGDVLLNMFPQSSDQRDLVLMPNLVGYSVGIKSDGSDRLDGVAEGEPTVHIGEASVTLSGRTFATWDARAPVGAFGTITLEDNGRKSPPVPLHRWKGQITVNETYGNGLNINATFTVHGRAMVVPPRSASVWDAAPTAYFNLAWDSGASFVSYTVSGEQTGDTERRTYTGQGTLIALTQDRGGMLADPDTGDRVTVTVGAPIQYTETITDLRDGSVTSNVIDTTLSIERTVALSPEWTVSAATYLDPTEAGFQEVNWSAMPADPPFEPDEAPR